MTSQRPGQYETVGRLGHRAKMRLGEGFAPPPTFSLAGLLWIGLWSMSLCRRRCLSVLLGLCASTVFAGAVFKAYALATVPFFESRYAVPTLMGVIAAVELLFCVWIVFGRASSIAKWRVTTLLFSSFVVVLGVKILRGETTCGCFGEFSPSPTIMFTIDIGFVGLLLAARWLVGSVQAPVRLGVSSQWLIVAWLGVVLVSGVLIAGSRSRMVMRDGLPDSGAESGSVANGATPILGRTVQMPDGRRAVLLEPERWIGRPLPLLPYIEPEELRNRISGSREDCEIVIFRRDCDRCRRLIAKISTQTGDDAFQLVLLEVVSSYPHKVAIGDETARVKWGRLAASIDWYVSTPTVIRLSQGKVAKVVGDGDSVSAAEEENRG